MIVHHPVAGHPVRVVEHAGVFEPLCPMCSYVGKKQRSLATAAAALRGHVTARSHRRMLTWTAIGRGRGLPS